MAYIIRLPLPLPPETRRLMASSPKTITDAEFNALPADVQKLFLEAEKECRDAASLFDLGVARGLLMCLQRLGRVDLTTVDAMYRRCRQSLPAEVVDVIDALPAEHRSDWSTGETYPRPRGSRKST